MCELFAVSSDQSARLRYRLSKFATHGGGRYANGDGWGIVFNQPRAPGLHMRELDPSGAGWRVKGADLSDGAHYRILIASVPLDDGPWQDLAEGATLLIEKGKVIMEAGRA